MSRWWCWHAWSNWETVASGNLVRDGEDSASSFFILQRRTCVHCQKVEIKNQRVHF